MDVVFEWDERKNRENQQNYGITFDEAKEVFRDPGRLIIKETVEGPGEARWFCIGTIAEKIVKVGFTYQEDKNIEILWSKILEKTTKAAPQNKDTRLEQLKEYPLGLLGEPQDFLPPLEQLVFRPKGIKVKLTLSEESIIYFKEQGERLHTPYTRLIRNLIDEYVRRQQARS